MEKPGKQAKSKMRFKTCACLPIKNTQKQTRYGTEIIMQNQIHETVLDPGVITCGNVD